MGKIDSLTNINFKVLPYLYDLKGNDNLVRRSQTEISKDLDLIRATVNTEI